MVALFLTIQQQGYAQETNTFHQLDSITYACYQDANWDCVIEHANTALEQGIDYYFLRMRLGIAYFAMQKYRLAASQFEHALMFNSNDETAIKYLLKAYEWGGQHLEAAALERRFPVIQSISSGIIKSVQLNGGISLSKSQDVVDKLDLAGEAMIYGEADYAGNFQLGQVGLLFAPLRGYRWSLAYGRLSVDKHQNFMLSDSEVVKRDYTLMQQQLSVSLPLRVSPGLHLYPELDVFFINSQPWSVAYDPVLYAYNFSRSEVSFNNFVASLKLVKTFPFADLGIAFSQSDLNGNDQSQVSLIAGTYPLYNLNLYTYTRLSAAAQHGEMQIHFKQIVGFRAAKHLWLQAGVHLGQLENVPDESATLMYNVAGRVIYNAMASAIIIFNDNLRLLLDMNYTEQENSYITFYDLTSYSNNTYRFNNIQLKGGLLWKL